MTIDGIFKELEKWGAAMAQIHAENKDPDEDTLIVAVKGRDEIKDIKEAIAKVQLMWDELED